MHCAPVNVGAGEVEGTRCEHAFCLNKGFSVALHVVIWSLKKHTSEHPSTFIAAARENTATRFPYLPALESNQNSSPGEA